MQNIAINWKLWILKFKSLPSIKISENNDKANAIQFDGICWNWGDCKCWDECEAIESISTNCIFLFTSNSQATAPLGGSEHELPWRSLSFASITITK